MRRVHTALAVICLLPLLFGTLGPVRAEDESPESPEPAEKEEPKLEGEAKKKHDKEVKALVKYLHKEKIWGNVRHKIDELGNQGSRAARDALMRYIFPNKNQERVDYALKALSKIKGKKTVEFICGKNALRSRQFLVQISSAEALEFMKDKRSVGPLLEVMTGKRTKTKVICACAMALAKVAPKDEVVIETLLEFSDHRKDTICAYVMSALGHIKTDAAVERLVDALHNDSNTRVREYAATALGTTGRADTLDELRKASVTETTAIVRQAILRAITTLEGG